MDRIILALISTSFSSSGPVGSSESDIRFVYSACVISALINDWSGVDIV